MPSISEVFRILLMISCCVCILFTGGCGESEDNDPDEMLTIMEDPIHSYASYPIGVAIDSPHMLDDDIYYRSLATHHHNSATPGNDMKMDALHPDENSYSWDNAEEILDFCNQHEMRVHGHVLVWHQQVPSWMEEYEGTPEEWEAILKDHIQTIITHFAGSVDSWDVVNEAFEENGQLRHTIWRDNIGDDYIAKCFQWAREAGPSIKLFYNDFSLSYNAQKMQAVLEMIDDFRSRDPEIPIDGIGFQMHISDDQPLNEYIQAAVDSVKSRDLLIHFSELDVSLNKFGLYSELTEEMKIRQKERYSDIVQIYNTIPRDQQFGITIWGISDADSWIRYCFNRLDWPLLFDEEFEPKPAFWGFVTSL